MNSPGQDLKKERESKGISLKEISSSTRITLKFLTALEEDRLDIFPGKFFLKAILRSYAKAVGLNEEDIVSRYRDALETPQPEAGEKPEEREPGAVLSGRRRVWLYTAAAVILAGIILIAFSVFKKGKPAAAPAKIVTAPLIQQDQVPAQAKAEPETQPQKPPQEQGLEITLDFVEETWIQLFVDGEVRLNGLLAAGQQYSTRALKEIKINIGNAGGVSFTLNGKRGKPFGLRGEVIYDILITPDKLREFQLPGQNAGPGINARAGRS
jgi:cytoskeletal protein RodZ